MNLGRWDSAVFKSVSIPAILMLLYVVYETGFPLDLDAIAGNQHFPNAPDDSREPNGKAMMRKGMSYYLGVHSEYQAELIDYQYGYNAVSIKHKFSAKGKRADGSEFSYSKIALDVLELENGKVSVIRRYSE